MKYSPRYIPFAILAASTAACVAIHMDLVKTNSRGLESVCFATIDNGKLWLHSENVPYRGSVISMAGVVPDIAVEGVDWYGLYWRTIRQFSAGQEDWTLALSVWYIWLLVVVLLASFCVAKNRFGKRYCEGADMVIRSNP